MAECNVYGASNHVAAKAEKATAELVKKQLVDIRSKTTPSQLFNYSVNTIQIVFIYSFQNMLCNDSFLLMALMWGRFLRRCFSYLTGILWLILDVNSRLSFLTLKTWCDLLNLL